MFNAQFQGNVGQLNKQKLSFVSFRKNRAVEFNLFIFHIMLIRYYKYNNHITTIINKTNLHLLLMKQKRTVASYDQLSCRFYSHHCSLHDVNDFNKIRYIIKKGPERKD